jgi:hypothetical protein
VKTAFVERKRTLAPEMVESPVAELRLAGVKPQAGQVAPSALRPRGRDRDRDGDKDKTPDKLKQWMKD